MKYIANNKTEQAIIYDESQVTEAEAREIIESDYPVRDGSRWEEFNILNHGKAYQIVDFEGVAEEDAELYDNIDPIWYCYQYMRNDFTFDEGSWSLEEAIQEARQYSVDMTVYYVGLRENYIYATDEFQPAYCYEIESYRDFLVWASNKQHEEDADLIQFSYTDECGDDLELYRLKDLMQEAESYWEEHGEYSATIYEW